MSEENRTILKAFFETGDTPTESEFIDLIDSSVNINEDIVNGTEKPVPVNADKLSIWDSVAGVLKTISFANIITYFSTIYPIKANVLELDNTDAFTPDADYEPATKKYVDDSGGGGEYQIYSEKIWIDAATTSFWAGIAATGTVEYNSNTGIAVAASMVTVGASVLKGQKYIGVAQGNQTIESFRLHVGNTSSFLDKISIIKARMSGNYGTIDSISVLLEQAIDPYNASPQGYIDFVTADFADSSISDKDLIFLFFATSTTSDISPCSYRLKCSID